MTKQDELRDRAGAAREETNSISRRQFVGQLGRAGLALPAVGLLMACGDSAEPTAPAGKAETPRDAGQGQAMGGGPSGSMGEPSEATPAMPAAPAEPSPAPQQAQAADGAGTPAKGALVTEVPAMASLAQTLNYVNQTEKPDQRCSGCQLYYEPGDGRGRCRLFTQGQVNANGWCTSWIRNPNAAT